MGAFAAVVGGDDGRLLAGCSAVVGGLPGSDLRGGRAGFGWVAADPDAVWSGSGVTVVADARLDDRAGLCAALGVPDAGSVADAELIGLAYARWGESCVRRLVGDFAFVLWDAGSGRMVGARDFVGARPLYHARVGSAVVVASTIDALGDGAGVPRRLDLAYVRADLRDRAFWHPSRTFHAGVARVPPGHLLTVSGATVSTSGSWEPGGRPEIRLGSDREYVEHLEAILRESNRDRVRGDSLVGAHMSGGIGQGLVEPDALLAAMADEDAASLFLAHLGRRGDMVSR